MSPQSHGMTGTKTYNAWNGMLSRCTNSRNLRWKDYGGRGIKVCKRWRKFRNFLADMGEAPKGLSLERKNNDGDYKPSNCKWATTKEQMNNTRLNHWLTLDGVTLTMNEWAKRLNVRPHTILTRLIRGRSVRDSLVPAWQNRKRRDVNTYARGEAMGKCAKLSEPEVLSIRAAREVGIDVHTVAREFGISHWTVYGIWERRSWTHL